MSDRTIPDPADQPTIPAWPDAGRIMNLGKSATYEAVARGDIPSIRVGRRILIPTAALRRLLQIDDVPASQ